MLRVGRWMHSVSSCRSYLYQQTTNSKSKLKSSCSLRLCERHLEPRFSSGEVFKKVKPVGTENEAFLVSKMPDLDGQLFNAQNL